jgi:hypothetical protein
MDQLVSFLRSGLATDSGKMLGFFIVVAAIFLFTSLASAFLRKRQSSQIISGNVPPELQQQLLSGLGTVQRDLSATRLVTLCVVMAMASGTVVYIYLKVPRDGDNAPLIAYASIIYVAIMLSTLTRLLRAFRGPSVVPGALAGPLRGASSKISMTIRTPSGDHNIDDQALGRARQHMDQGGSIDEACALMDPQYESMNPTLKEAFKKGAEMALAQYRKIHP